MFMSESYVHIREDISDNDFLDITLKPKWRAKNDSSSKTLSKAQSEMSLADLKDPGEEKPARTKSLSTLDYDGDTDSIDKYDDDESEEILLKCSICDIEYTAYIDNHLQHGDDIIDHGVSKKKSRKSLRRKRRKNREEEHRLKKINFEEYKDWAHRMEEFDPDAERKWTLEYQFNVESEHQENQLRLSKIVIARGHKNEYPELNNIHLFDDVKAYESTKWRNFILQEKIQQNENVQECYSLIPANTTCLFCFTERQLEVTNAVREDRPLVALAPVNGSCNLDGYQIPDDEKPAKDVAREEREALGNGDARRVTIAEKFTTKHQKQKKWRQNIIKKFKTKSFHSMSKLQFKTQPKKIEEEDEEEDDDEEFEVLDLEAMSGVL